MGVVEDAKNKAQKEAAKTAFKAGLDAIKNAAASLADDILGFAEKELGDAEALRKGRLDALETPTEDIALEKTRENLEKLDVLSKEDSEEKARQKLAELKGNSDVQKGEPKEQEIDMPEVKQVEPQPEPRLSNYKKMEIEREQRAKEELERLKLKMGLTPPTPPSKKTL